jgi:hypothetical protein
LYPLSVLITSYFSLVLYGLLVKMIKWATVISITF